MTIHKWHKPHDPQEQQASAEAHTPDPETAPNVAQRLRIHSQLPAWYAAEGRRHLPWRHTRDPYAVLVSEIMLQQTQVERVLPKYSAFLAQFPSLADLAAAPTAEVIKAWAGLGYNMRAVRLQEIARQAVAAYDSALPNTLDGLLALKGIGRYTAGAIACFAFEQPVATVDTNIRRVLWRVFRGIEPLDWPTGERAAREVLALAEWALPAENAYDWQQALMDLGATICVSRRPLCERCPLVNDCAAYAETAQLTLFPSGEALARIRDERANEQDEQNQQDKRAGIFIADEAAAIGIADAPQQAKQAKQASIAETPAVYRVDGRQGENASENRQRGKNGKNGKKREPFEQSSRYFRGRVVDVLRTLEPGEALALAAVGPRIKPDFAADDAAQIAWLRGVVEGLARDGLVRLIAPQDERENPDGFDSALALRIALP